MLSPLDGDVNFKTGEESEAMWTINQEARTSFIAPRGAGGACVLPGKGRGCKGLREALGGGWARMGATSLCPTGSWGCLEETGAAFLWPVC